MTGLIFLVEQIATGLYLLIGVGLVLSLRGYLRARREYRATHFELEREMARERRTGALTTFVLLLEFALLVFGVQNIVAPTLRSTIDVEEVMQVAMDDGEFNTPTPAPLTGGIVIDASGVQLGEQDPADQIIATPTLTPTPVGTIIPNAPAVTGCDSPDAMLQIPANGMLVFEPTTVVGTANTENFAFYRFELKGDSTFGSFATVGGDRTLPVPELGELGQFVPAFYPPGTYQFRLVVFDITNTVRASCTITIYLSEPIPTATPLGTAAAP